MSVPAPASPGHGLWRVAVAAQADYETLRAHMLATGATPDSLIAARFDALAAGRGPRWARLERVWCLSPDRLARGRP